MTWLRLQITPGLERRIAEAAREHDAQHGAAAWERLKADVLRGVDPFPDDDEPEEAES